MKLLEKSKVWNRRCNVTLQSISFCAIFTNSNPNERVPFGETWKPAAFLRPMAIEEQESSFRRRKMPHEVKRKAFQGRYFRTSCLKIWRFIEGYTFCVYPFSCTEKPCPQGTWPVRMVLRGCVLHTSFTLFPFAFRLIHARISDNR